MTETILKAWRRIPDEYRKYTFYSSWDWWRFTSEPLDEKTCPICRAWIALPFKVFPGSVIRTLFPWHRIQDEYTIVEPCHPNCRHLLVRTSALRV